MRTDNRECPICKESDPYVFVEGEYVNVGVGDVKCSPDFCQRCGYEEVGNYSDDAVHERRVAHNVECERKWKEMNREAGEEK